MKKNESYNENYNNESILKKIIFTCNLLALTFVMKYYLRKFLPLRIIRLFFLTDFLCYIPLLILHLYSKKKISFIGVFLIECFIFFSRSSSFPYNPVLSLSYAFCWGFLPSLFVKREKESFLKIYFIICFLFCVYFFLFHIPNLLWIRFAFLDKNFSFNFRNNKFSLVRISSCWSIFILFMNFLSIFIVSLVDTYFYHQIKKRIITLI
ncbi:hypothetical protein ['Camptotheca acuminata' phytoplasma]|uniref:hypothetical protein n=1 Tax='Camptotheca acuminata' phytoplasma TaxID=3239192 RepID=UPI00351A9326